MKEKRYHEKKQFYYDNISYSSEKDEDDNEMKWKYFWYEDKIQAIHRIK